MKTKEALIKEYTQAALCMSRDELRKAVIAECAGNPNAEAEEVLHTIDELILQLI